MLNKMAAICSFIQREVCSHAIHLPNMYTLKHYAPYSDEKGHPKDIIKSILPKWNQLTFFEVTSTSYHQVQEVLGNRDRLSIRYTSTII